MAKEKKSKIDDFDFDSDLDFDFNIDDSVPAEVGKDDRKPISKGLKATATGFGKSFTGEANLKDMLRKSLPKEYGTPLSSVFEIQDSVKDLYDTANEKTRAIIKESKRSIGKIAGNLESVLPKKVSERLKEWSKTDEQSAAASKEAMENQTIDSAFAEIFAATEQAKAENSKKQEARQVISDQIEQKRHVDLTQVLGSIDQSLIQLTTYQQKIGTNYLKKSLELQFRTYFIQSDMLQLQTKYFQEFKTDLGAITKNTGLPDYLKKTTKEALKEHLRAETFGVISDTILSKPRDYIRGVTKKAKGKLNEAFSSIRDGVSMGLDMAEMLSDTYKLQEEMSEDFGMEKQGFVGMAGGLAGSALGNKARDKIAGKIRSRLEKSPTALKHGRNLDQIFSNLPQYVNEKINKGPISEYIPDFLRDILTPESLSTSVKMTKEEDLDRAKQWDSRSHLSLNVIIPKYLAKIHKEIYTLRTGDTGVDELEWDLETGKFVGQKESVKNKLGSVFSKSAVESNKYTSDKIFDILDPEKKISKEDKEDLLKHIYKANDNKTYFNKDNVLNMSSSLKSMELETKLKDLLEHDKDNEQIHRLTKHFHDLGDNRSNVTEKIQYLIHNGKHGDLIELGLLDPKTGYINQDKVREIEITGELPNLPESKNRSKTEVKKGFFSNLFSGKPTKIDSLEKDFTKEVYSKENVESDLKNLIKEQTTLFKDIKRDNPDQIVELDKLENAIKEANSKDLVKEIRDILLEIKEKGLSTRTGSGLSIDEVNDYINANKTGYFGKFGRHALKPAKLAIKGAWDAAKFSTRQSKFLLTNAYRGAKTTVKGTYNLLANTYDRFDLFVGEELEPRLKSAKLKSGKYIDVTTGKAIEKFEDIKGDIKDIDTGEIVLYASELKGAVLKNFERTKSLLLSSLDWGKKAIASAWNMAKFSFGRSHALVKFGISTIKKAAKKIIEFLTKEQQDIYLGDDLNKPVLLKRILESGGYIDKVTGNVITRISDIKGDVTDREGNIVLSVEDMKKGLFDKEGKPIITGMTKVKDWLKTQAKKSIRFHKAVWDKTKEGLSALGEVISNPLDISIGMGKGIKKTNSILIAIYKLLYNKFTDQPFSEETFDDDYTINKPGLIRRGIRAVKKFNDIGMYIGKAALGKGWLWGKSKQDDVESIKSKSINKLEEAHLKAQEKMEKLGKRYNEFKDEKWDKKKGLYIDPATDVMRKGMHEIVATLRERIPEPVKKKFYDWDGDGIREGSIDDLRNKREGLGNDTDPSGQITDGDKKSPYSGLKDFLLGKLGKFGKIFQNGLIPGIVTLMATGVGKVLKTAFRWGIKPLAKGIFGLSKIITFGFGKMIKGLFLNRVTTALAGKIMAMAQAAGSALKGGLGKLMPKSRGGKAAALGGLVAAGMALFSSKASAGEMGELGALTGFGGPKGDEDDISGMSGSIYNPKADFENDDGGFDLGDIPSSLGLGGLGLAGLAGLGGTIANAAGGGMEDLIDPSLDPRKPGPKPGPKTPPGSAAKPKGFFGRQWDKIKGVGARATSSVGNAISNATTSALDKAKSFGGSAWDKLKSGASSLYNKGKAVASRGYNAAKTGIIAAKDAVVDLTKRVVKFGSGLAKKVLNPKIAGRLLTGLKWVARVGTKFIPILGWALLIYDLYEVYSWLKNKSPVIGEIEKVRTIQYGFSSPTDVETYQKVRVVESILAKSEVVRNGKIEIDDDKLSDDIATITNVFDIKPEDEEGIVSVINWLTKRVIPIYLHDRNLMLSLNIKSKFSDLDKEKDDVKRKYLDAMAASEDFYSKPYFINDKTPTSYQEVLAQIQSAKNKLVTDSVKPNKDVLTEGGAYLGKTYKAPERDADHDSRLKRLKEYEEVMKTGSGKQRAIAAAAHRELMKKHEELEKMQQGPNPVHVTGSTPQQTGSGFSGSSPYTPSGPSTPPKPGMPIDVSIAASSGGDIKDVPKPEGQTAPKGNNWPIVKDTIVTASKKVGVDPKLAAAISAIESNFNYLAKAGTSSASGLFQFINSTWDTMKKKYADKWGIDKSAHQFDPRANALLGAEFLKENVDGLKKRVNRPPTATDAYMAHFMGLGGAGKFLKAMQDNPGMIGAQSFPREAAANKPVFYPNGRPATLAQIYDTFTKKLSDALKARKISDQDFLDADKSKEPKEVEIENAESGVSTITSTPVNDDQPTTREQDIINAQGGIDQQPQPTAEVKSEAGLDSSNPNIGPQTEAMQPSVSSITPNDVVENPRPAQPQSQAYVAPTAPAIQSTSFEQAESIRNLGDSISIFKESLQETKNQTNILQKIAEGVDTLPNRLSGVFGSMQNQPNTPTPSVQRRREPPSEAKGATNSFTRRYAA